MEFLHREDRVLVAQFSSRELALVLVIVILLVHTCHHCWKYDCVVIELRCRDLKTQEVLI